MYAQSSTSLGDWFQKYFFVNLQVQYLRRKNAINNETIGKAPCLTIKNHLATIYRNNLFVLSHKKIMFENGF
jgi:hypothetical protein